MNELAMPVLLGLGAVLVSLATLCLSSLLILWEHTFVAESDLEHRGLGVLADLVRFESCRLIVVAGAASGLAALMSLWPPLWMLCWTLALMASGCAAWSSWRLGWLSYHTAHRVIRSWPR